MGRRPKPWYREDRQSWFVTISGERHNLGPDKDEAERQFHELMSKPKAVQVRRDCVVSVLDSFLAWTDSNRAPRTHEFYLRFLQPFAKSIGTLGVDDIRTHHVQAFIDGLQTGDSVKNMAYRALNAAFRWGIRQELMTRNPASAVEKPASLIREAYVTEAEYSIIMANTPDQEFRDVLITAWQCGARPQEIRAVETCHCEPEKARWSFAHGKRGLRRFVYLTADVEAITRRLMELHPTGPIYRNTQGRPWTKDAMTHRFKWLASKVGRTVSLYLFRHAQITRQLAAGVDSHVVAQLSGHRNTKMLDQVYSHVANDWEFMRDQLRGTGTGEQES